MIGGELLTDLDPKTVSGTRDVPFMPQTAAMLRDYLREHPHRADKAAPLFPAVKMHPAHHNASTRQPG